MVRARSVRPVVQPSLVEEVTHRLRQLVEAGDLQPGEKLPSEPDLVGQLRVSRTVLREAIKRLESIGLLTVRRGSGTFVGDRASLAATTRLIRSAMTISPRDLLKVSEFRRAIETQCAYRCAERISDEQIVELQTIYDAMISASGNLTASMRRDFEFHLFIVGIGGNELMRNTLEVLQEFVFAAMVQTLEQPGLPQPPKDQHKELLEAIRARDPVRAQKAAAAHMDLVDERLKFVEGKFGKAGVK
ncbi:MAG TPA: FadR/GntR family transcriptional regulator [Planctomycetota bacterium]|nr:FadR/GntR family transcriptional regulator [Planctomycetota bacterium]